MKIGLQRHEWSYYHVTKDRMIILNAHVEAKIDTCYTDIILMLEIEGCKSQFSL